LTVQDLQVPKLRICGVARIDEGAFLLDGKHHRLAKYGIRPRCSKANLQVDVKHKQVSQCLKRNTELGRN
jgi:hypothetical protein